MINMQLIYHSDPPPAFSLFLPGSLVYFGSILSWPTRLHVWLTVCVYECMYMVLPYLYLGQVSVIERVYYGPLCELTLLPSVGCHEFLLNVLSFLCSCSFLFLSLVLLSLNSRTQRMYPKTSTSDHSFTIIWYISTCITLFPGLAGWLAVGG